MPGNFQALSTKVAINSIVCGRSSVVERHLPKKLCAGKFGLVVAPALPLQSQTFEKTRFSLGFLAFCPVPVEHAIAAPRHSPLVANVAHASINSRRAGNSLERR